MRVTTTAVDRTAKGPTRGIPLGASFLVVGVTFLLFVGLVILPPGPTSSGGPINSHVSDSFACPTGSTNGSLQNPTITVNQSSGLIPLSIQFCGTPNGGTPPYTFAWNFSDGNTSSAQNVAHTFIALGVYWVSLHVTDSHGALNQSGITILARTVKTQPIAVGLLASPTSGAAPLTVNLTARPIGCWGLCEVTFFISNGTGSTNVGPDPGPSVASGTNVTVFVTGLSPGPWQATVFAQDLLSDNGSANATINVTYGTGSLSVTATADPNLGAAPLLTTLKANVTGGTVPLRENWTFGDGGNGTGTIIQHMYSAPGNYWATVRVVDALGKNTSAAVSIDVTGGTTGPGLLTLNFTGSPLSGSAPLVVAFVMSASGGTPPYALSICAEETHCFVGASDWSGMTLTLHENYSYVGDFAASAVATDSKGAQAVATVRVFVESSTPLSVSGSTSATTGTAPTSIALSANVIGGSPPYTIQWAFGDGTFGSSLNGGSITHTYQFAGIFTPILTAVDAANHRVNQTLPSILVQEVPGSVNPLQQVLISGATFGVFLALAATFLVGFGLGYVWFRKVTRRNIRREGEAIVLALGTESSSSESHEADGNASGAMTSTKR